MSKTPDSQTVSPAEMLAAATSQVQELVKSVSKDGKQFKHAYDNLKAAADAANEAGIKLFRPDLDRARNMLDLNLTDVQYAQDYLARLRQDPKVMAAHAARVEKLGKAIALARKQFIDRVRLARELDARVDKANHGIRKAQREAEVEIGALRLRVRGTARTLTDALPRAQQLAVAARKAFEKKDQKALTEARMQLIDLKSFDGNVMRLRPQVQKVLADHKDLDREQRAEVQWMLDDLARVEDVPAAIDRLVKETMALGQVPAAAARPAPAAADVLKAIRTFGLPDDGSRRTKAAKVLSGIAVEAWPRGLTRLYGCKEAELKARLGEVRKLAFVRSMALIDL